MSQANTGHYTPAGQHCYSIWLQKVRAVKPCTSTPTAHGVAAGPPQCPAAHSAPRPPEQWPQQFPGPAKVQLDRYLLLNAAPSPTAVKSAPSLASPLPWLGPPHTAQLGTHPMRNSQTPSQKEKNAAESPNLTSAGSQSWQEVQGLTTSNPKTSRDLAPCIPALPWGFPHVGCSRERPWKPKVLPQRTNTKRDFPRPVMGSQEDSSEGLGVFGTGRGGRKGAADSIFEGDRVSASQAKWKRLLPSQGMRCCQRHRASEDLFAQPGCAHCTLGHRIPTGLWLL